MRLEVRCCCVPEKLLGWMDWPDDLGKRVTFVLMPEGGARWCEDDEPMACVRFASATLSTALISPWDGCEPYRAVKAEGVPVEVLRRIPQFTERK